MNFILCIASLLLGSSGAFALMSLAAKWGFVDHPNLRSSHATPMPKGGGVGILAAFLVSSLVLRIPPALWIPAAVLAGISFAGDRWDLSPAIRMISQLIAALIVVRHLEFENPTSAFLLPLLVVYIVGTANCYNFMDGINGIAGLTGVVGFGLLGIYSAFASSGTYYSVLAFCVAFSCLGFLPFNMPKARVFMGDVGSILLGFVFASLTVSLSRSLLDFICLTGFLLPFYADEVITVLIRLKRGESLVKPHRIHLYQILANEAGIRHWKVSVAYAFIQAVAGASILIARLFGIVPVVMVWLISLAAFVAANYVIRTALKMGTADFRGFSRIMNHSN